MIIINSASYVNSEFRNELGMIPPCFLPVGNKSLLFYQITALKKYFNDHRVVLSLPSSYVLNERELFLIESMKIEVVFVQDDLSLGMSLLYILNTIDLPYNSLKLLHGDTLFDTFPNDEDCIALSESKDDYNWEYNAERSAVWSGFFSFSIPKKFIRALAIAQGDFIRAVKTYASESITTSLPLIESWHDLGHINTYFQSRSSITTQRVFNSLKIENGVVWKSGTPEKKIEAEANWFSQLPSSLKKYTPQLIQVGRDEGRLFYETEYLSILPLNEIFVHGKNTVTFWEKVLDLITVYLKESRRCFPKMDSFNTDKIRQDSISLYRDKTLERLNSYIEQSDVNLDSAFRYNGMDLPSLRDVISECINKSLSLPVIPSVLHGDLCFSNIMYDSRSDNIKVIDPRGLNILGELTIYGNQSYDLAKLYHSFIGLYDFIIADSFTLKRTDELGFALDFRLDTRLLGIQKMFLSKEFIPGITSDLMMAPTILLFLSMIPLHNDKPHRQDAMLANAMRLYSEWIMKK